MNSKLCPKCFAHDCNLVKKHAWLTVFQEFGSRQGGKMFLKNFSFSVLAGLLVYLPNNLFSADN